jgi:hypothetical protein
MPKLNQAQLRALLEFYEIHGDGWKSALTYAWRTRRYQNLRPGVALCLKQIRETHGWAWLITADIKDIAAQICTHQAPTATLH